VDAAAGHSAASGKNSSMVLYPLLPWIEGVALQAALVFDERSNRLELGLLACTRKYPNDP